MLNAFLVALAVFICVGGGELLGFTMLNRPIVIGPLVGNRNSRRNRFCNHVGKRK